MEFIKESILSDSEKLQIFSLWNTEYPEQLAYNTVIELNNYLNSLKAPSHILILDTNKNIKGWYVDFIREQTKWFVILLDSTIQGRGLGTQIINMAKDKETELCGWVIDHNNDYKRNGTLYKSPLSFYLKNGFNICRDAKLQSDKISAVKVQWKSKYQI
ncbi:GNAT family N-acetyltransferase [Formosa sp. S-31]|uniref:GNAT family N-acetyltransferase n=1 Tax=Formosa sp. S-31 TaxID=2790949 RepID=UPI003EC0AE2B